ncbi:MAG: hypothetical protein M0Q53_07230 [Prolixibacteraceae bacterium]|jgi:hypothetical protein|nr:hypothetical protein [Prolixibacteraceae bacterium]
MWVRFINRLLHTSLLSDEKLGQAVPPTNDSFFNTVIKGLCDVEDYEYLNSRYAVYFADYRQIASFPMKNRDRLCLFAMTDFYIFLTINRLLRSTSYQ